MKRFTIKLALFTLPFLVWQVIEIFILPFDTFTFRAWESIGFHKLRWKHGPFYPNQSQFKISSGDSDPERRQKKPVHFETDSFGFRNRQNVAVGDTFDIAVIGDSNIAGSNLDQSDTFSEVLQKQCHCKVYNYGSGGILRYVNDPRFQARPPHYLILQVRRGDIMNMALGSLDSDCDYTREPGFPYGVICKGHENFTLLERIANQLPVSLHIYLDHALKQIAWHRFRARFDLIAIPNRSRPGGPPRKSKSESEIITIGAEAINSIYRVIGKRGTKLVFVLWPDHSIRAADKIVSQLDPGIRALTFMPTKQLPYGYDPNTWASVFDDHWNENSVREVSEMVVKLMK